MKNKLRIIKAKLRANKTNATGWKTNRKLLVIESDDWGSIRIPSNKVYTDFVNKGFGVENSLYNRYDTLADANDLTALFETLQSYKDIHGRSLKITANTVVANPDFKKIHQSDFQQYYFEDFTQTLERYPKHKGVFKLWKQGIEEKIFQPQFHAHEHLNVNLWMKALRSKDETIRYTFDRQTTYSGKSDYSFMDAFDFENKEELDLLKDIAADGLKLFEKIFGFRSKSFIAPCYIWHPELEPVLNENEVEYIQGLGAQLVPTEKHFEYTKIKHRLGDVNNLGQIYLRRNVTFEPSSVDGMDWVNYAMAQIETAFIWGKPAIITSHRVNYIGFLDEKNRDRSLKLLKELIRKVQKKWPEVEFMSSDELGDVIKESYK